MANQILTESVENYVEYSSGTKVVESNDRHDFAP